MKKLALLGVISTLALTSASAALASTTFTKHLDYTNATADIFGSADIVIDSSTNLIQSVSGTETYLGVTGNFTGLANYASADNTWYVAGSHLSVGGDAFTTDQSVPGIIDIFDYGGVGAIAFSVDPGGSDVNAIVPITATFTDVAAAGGVPEPASWALMILGFGGAGAMLRNRRRVHLVST